MTSKNQTQEKLVESIRKTRQSTVKKKVATKSVTRQPAKPQTQTVKAQKKVAANKKSSTDAQNNFQSTNRVWPD